MALFVTNIEQPFRKTLEDRQKHAIDRLHTNSVLTGTSRWMHQKQSFVRLISNAKIEDGFTLTPKNNEFNIIPNDFRKTVVNIQDTNIVMVEKVPTFNEEIRKQWILNGSLAKGKEFNDMRSGFSELYSNIRNVPNPGIIDINIKNKGAFGSVREATINYTCFCVEHLEILEMLYMTPGVACFLEWGWSLLPDGNINPYKMDIDITRKMDTCVLREVQRLVKAAGGHYDALKGVVSNFTWKQNDKGGFDCSTTMVSMADTFLSADIKTMSRGMIGKSIELGDDGKIENEGKNKPRTNIDYVFEEIYRWMDNAPGGSAFFYNDKSNSSTLDSSKIYRSFQNKVAVTEGSIPLGFSAKVNMKPEGFLDKIATFIGIGTGKTQYYVTWGFIEDFIVTNSLGFVSKDNSNVSDDCITNNITINEEINGIKTEDKNIEISDDSIFGGAVKTPTTFKPIFPKLNSYGTKIFNDPCLMSGDPLICLLPGNGIFGNLTLDLSMAAGGGSGQDVVKFIPDNIPYFDGSNVKPDTGNIAQTRTGTAAGGTHSNTDNTQSTDNSYKGYVRNICVNLKFIKETYEQTDTLDAFVMALLNGISDVCGQAWKFGLFVNENNPNTISVVDLNTWKEGEQILPVNLTGFGVDSLMRELSINTEVDGNIKGHIMFGVNQKKGSSDISTKGTNGYQFYGRQVRDITYDNIQQSDVDYGVARDGISEKDPKKKVDQTPAGLKKSLFNAMFQLMIERTQETCDSAKTAMTAYLVGTHGGTGNTSNDNSYTEDKKTSKVILPVKLNFTIDGMSGLKFGNCINVTGLPNRYAKGAYFTITNVEHSVQGNDWTTTVDTVMRVAVKKDGSDEAPTNLNPSTNNTTVKGTNTSNTGNTVLVINDPALSDYFKIPASGTYMSPMGYRTLTNETQKYHHGIDITPNGFNTIIEYNNSKIPVNASYDGTITKSKGNQISIRHIINEKVYFTNYHHFKILLVKENDTVKTGDLIGYMGAEGHCVSSHGACPPHGVHLHFEIRGNSEQGAHYDPQAVLSPNQNWVVGSTWINIYEK
jgi:murein DD-endopeptidase MepM/ murein hydrolase activator NlpD